MVTVAARYVNKCRLLKNFAPSRNGQALIRSEFPLLHYHCCTGTDLVRNKKLHKFFDTSDIPDRQQEKMD